MPKTSHATSVVDRASCRQQMSTQAGRQVDGWLPDRRAGARPPCAGQLPLTPTQTFGAKAASQTPTQKLCPACIALH